MFNVQNNIWYHKLSKSLKITKYIVNIKITIICKTKTQSFHKNKFYIFKISLMLRKITRLLQSTCMCWLHYLKSTYRWCVVLRPTLGQEQYMHVLHLFQHANNEVLPATPTITQRWPNNCLLIWKAFKRLSEVERTQFWGLSLKMHWGYL